MKNNTQIWCTYHNAIIPGQYRLQDTDLIKLYHSNDHNTKGQNINNANAWLSEIVTYYYVWKNNLKSDYVGFCHYRRHFNDIDYNQIDKLGIQTFATYKIKNLDALQQFMRKIPNTTKVLDYFSEWLMIYEGIDFKKRYEREGDITVSTRLSFIMTWDMFQRICGFVFGFLDWIAEKDNLGDWKFNNIYKIHNVFFENNQYNSNFARRREISIILEFLVGIYINLIHENPWSTINNADQFNRHCIITHGDEIFPMFDFYKRNVKTGIQRIINITNNADAFNSTMLFWWNYPYMYLVQNEEEAQKFIEENKLLEPFRLEQNEYIDCKDGFEFWKGNYSIQKI